MNGQAIKQDFYIVDTSVIESTQDIITKQKECCFELIALAEYSFTSKYKNDKHSVIWFFNELFTNAQIYLEKFVNGAWVETQLTNDDYGTFYEFGFFTNKFEEKAIGYQIDWAKILQDKGQGKYRFKGKSTPAIGNEVTYYSFEFKLLAYTDARADNTVYAQWNRSGTLGSKEKDSKVEDYGSLEWFNAIRIQRSTFGYWSSTDESEYIKYLNGSQVWVKDNDVEELTLEIVAIPEHVHKFLRVDMMQSGRILITDYSSTNPTKNVEREVVRASNYSPEWIRGVAYANVTLTFNPYYQNFTHLRE